MFATDLGAASVPGRGLFLSVLLHGLFAVATLLVPWSYWIPSEAHLLTQEQARDHETLLLPDLQPMSHASEPAPAPGSGHLAREIAKPTPRAATAAAAAVKAVRGSVQQGPQIIVSNPPHPDNFQQTILQPDLPPAKFSAPMPIPPMVAIARATPVLATPPPQPEPVKMAPAQPVPVLPASVAQQLPSVEAPKLPLPTNVAPQALDAVPSAAVPAKLPKLARAPVPLAGQSGDAEHNVLVIDAIPVPNARPAELPPGELHGAFTVAPTELIASGSGKAGGGSAQAGSPGVGTGNATYAGSYGGSGSATGAAGGSGTATVATGTGTGTGAANGTGTATGEGAGRGTGTGAGTSAGNGSGAGTGLGSGHDTGISIVSGNSPFSGITIQGGSTSGSYSRTTVPATGKRQTSYDVTIVASGASGGGFRDYGVFRDGASYTVYLDMADAGVRADWPLQYAPYFAPNQPDPPLEGGLQPPFAVTKVLPRLSGDAVRRSHGGKVVVFGVINAEGRWERLRVLQSPDPAFNQAVLDALAKWTFRPAIAAGHPMAVKCLLGLPVYSLAGR